MASANTCAASLKVLSMKLKGLIAGCLVAPAIATAATPVDTYFSVAVTENSHNHSGENLLFLDFQDQLNSALASNMQVVSPKVTDDSISLDGKLLDWKPEQFSAIAGRVMNNYPLSEFYDAVPTDIRLASAYDSQYLYFAIQFEDANHDASGNRNRWVYDGAQWNKQQHLQPNPGAPINRAINTTEIITGSESEDRVFFMFPVVDKQYNFRDGGIGCAGYCHTNLVDSGNPAEAIIGDGVVAMHTTLEGDLADIWHWTSTRSAPGRTLKDGHLIYAEGANSGRKADPGKSPDIDNDLKKLKLDGSSDQGPAYISHAEFEQGAYDKLSHTTQNLSEAQLLRVEPGMEFALGSSVPYSIKREASGSRSDVEVASHFDPASNLWTLEFKRLLDTGDAANDRNFMLGQAAIAPTKARPDSGNIVRGAKLFDIRKCAACHGEQGEGVYEEGRWLFPRVQRTSGSLIMKTTSPHRQKRLQALTYLRERGAVVPDALMPAIPISPQEAEDIAAWLQQQHIPVGR